MTIQNNTKITVTNFDLTCTLKSLDANIARLTEKVSPERTNEEWDLLEQFGALRCQIVKTQKALIAHSNAQKAEIEAEESKGFDPIEDMREWAFQTEAWEVFKLIFTQHSACLKEIANIAGSMTGAATVVGKLENAGLIVDSVTDQGTKHETVWWQCSFLSVDENVIGEAEEAFLDAFKDKKASYLVPNI